MSTATPTHSAIVRAVTRYETAALRYDELMRRPAADLTQSECDAITLARDVMAQSFGILAQAGRVDLTAPLKSAASYLYAAHHCQRLAACHDYDGCVDAQDEMAMHRSRLAEAGRLDLIEAV
ncbi:hypothetical protein ACFXAW_07020 [Streptomyces sp. NPDC059445]|uniref:hypothetical protein n=1 Tax=Streptomyces sp. NPDC059445 TaxID=3346832 RepID=UPI0036B9B3CA